MPAGTASAMVKRLDELGLAEHTPYHGVRLTADGRRVALRMLRRHRLLELFLAETLDLPWDRVHQEAELLEHSLSEELEAAIAERLGNPTHDPHGDPIPSPELELEETETISLAELDPGAEARFVRVSDADPAILRHLGERGLKPGAARRGSSSASRSAARSWSGSAGGPSRCRPRSPRACAWRRRCELAPGHRGRTPRSGGPAAARRRRPTPQRRADARPWPRPHRSAAARPGLRRGRRLRRPRQLRDQHRGRRQVRLPARLGDRRREPDGDARAVPVGEGRHRERPHAARALPRALPAPGHLGPVAPGRGDRDRDRPRGVRRRRDRAQPPVRRPALRRRPDDGRRSRSAILALQKRGYRRFELAIAALLGIVLPRVRSTTSPSPGWTPARSPAASCPASTGTDSVLLAVGILGATVMPHVVYLHSALTRTAIPAAHGRRAARAAALPAPRRGARDGPRRA